MEFNSIVAVQWPDLAIGKEGADLYNISVDRNRFAKITDGKIVMMGRKTWDGIPEQYKPLRNRLNAIISKTLEEKDVMKGAEVFRDWKKAVQNLRDRYPNIPIFVIGGGWLYKETLPYVQTLFVTEIYSDKEGGDTFFPSDYLEWEEIKEEEEKAVSKTGIALNFKKYKNPNPQKLD